MGLSALQGPFAGLSECSIHYGIRVYPCNSIVGSSQMIYSPDSTKHPIIYYIIHSDVIVSITIPTKTMLSPYFFFYNNLLTTVTSCKYDLLMHRQPIKINMLCHPLKAKNVEY